MSLFFSELDRSFTITHSKDLSSKQLEKFLDEGSYFSWKPLCFENKGYKPESKIKVEIYITP